MHRIDRVDDEYEYRLTPEYEYDADSLAPFRGFPQATRRGGWLLTVSGVSFRSDTRSQYHNSRGQAISALFVLDTLTQPPK